MMSKQCMLCVAALAIASIAGCPGLLEEPPARILVGAAGGQAYVTHYAKWSGFTTYPSTLWEVNAADGAVELIQDAVTQYDVQVAGDYFVAERPTADGTGSRVVAVQISTGDEITVLERDVVLGGRYDRVFALSDGQVVARTDTGLLVYDLDARAVAREIALDDTIAEIHAVSQDWALVTRGYAYSGDELVVDLATGAAVETPALPGGATGYFIDAVIVGDDLLTSSYVETGGSVTAVAVQVLDLATMAWRALVEYDGSDAAGFAPQMLFVRGADATHVLAQVYTPFVGCRLEVIDRASGARTSIAESLGFFAEPFAAHLDDGVAYWIDEGLDELLRYDIDGEQRSGVALDGLAP